jgi:hypothetical protein
MIFLQRVNGLRHYPVANALAQTFPHPVILNETGVPAALTKRKMDWSASAGGNADLDAAAPIL